MVKGRSKFPVGANVFVIKDNALLLGTRIKNNYEWGLPGGHVEFGEPILETARRELEEETGMTADSFDFLNFVNDYDRQGDKHYIHIGVLAINPQGVPSVCEGDVCGEWQFFPLNNLPENIFTGHRTLIKNYINKVIFTDG